VWNSILEQGGSVQHLDFLSQEEKDCYKTSFEIDQRWLLELAADRTPYIDQAQSLNLFIPADVEKWDLLMLHFRAWELGIKSLYYLRSKSVQRAGFAGGVEADNTIDAPKFDFFLERHRDIGIGAQPHLIALDIGDEADRDVMVMPGMAALSTFDLGARILLGQLDPVAIDMVDGADMDAVGADHFHMFLIALASAMGLLWLVRRQRTRTLRTMQEIPSGNSISHDPSA
jgi:hypothetical protein